MGFEVDPSPTVSGKGNATVTEEPLGVSESSTWTEDGYALWAVSHLPQDGAPIFNHRTLLCLWVSSFNTTKFQPVTPFCKDFRKIIHNCEKCPSLPGFLIGM